MASRKHQLDQHIEYQTINQSVVGVELEDDGDAYLVALLESVVVTASTASEVCRHLLQLSNHVGSKLNAINSILSVFFSNKLNRTCNDLMRLSVDLTFEVLHATKTR